MITRYLPFGLLSRHGRMGVQLVPNYTYGRMEVQRGRPTIKWSHTLPSSPIGGLRIPLRHHRVGVIPRILHRDEHPKGLLWDRLPRYGKTRGRGAAWRGRAGCRGRSGNPVAAPPSIAWTMLKPDKRVELFSPCSGLSPRLHPRASMAGQSPNLPSRSKHDRMYV